MGTDSRLDSQAASHSALRSSASANAGCDSARTPASATAAALRASCWPAGAQAVSRCAWQRTASGARGAVRGACLNACRVWEYR